MKTNKVVLRQMLYNRQICGFKTFSQTEDPVRSILTLSLPKGLQAFFKIKSAERKNSSLWIDCLEWKLHSDN